jgi:hypothetical protein
VTARVIHDIAMKIINLEERKIVYIVVAQNMHEIDRIRYNGSVMLTLVRLSIVTDEIVIMDGREKFSGFFWTKLIHK